MKTLEETKKTGEQKMNPYTKPLLDFYEKQIEKSYTLMGRFKLRWLGINAQEYRRLIARIKEWTEVHAIYEGHITSWRYNLLRNIQLESTSAKKLSNEINKLTEKRDKANAMLNSYETELNKQWGIDSARIL